MKRNVLSVLSVLSALLIGLLTPQLSAAADDSTASTDNAGDGLWVTSITSVGDGSQIAFATAQGLLLRESSVMLAPSSNPPAAQPAYQQPAAVWAVAASPDGQRLASTDYRGNLAVHDLQSSETQHHDKVMERWTRALVFSPDGKQIIGGNEAGKLLVWNLEQAAVEKTHDLDPHAIMEINFSPEGDLLAVADGAGHVHLLKWPALETVADITVCDQPVWSVVFADGGLLAGAANNRIYRCERSGGEAKEVAQLKDWVSRLAVGSNQLVAAAELNGRVQILSADGQPVGEASTAPSGVWSLHWTPNGTLLVGTRKHGVKMMQQSWSWTEPKPAEEKPAEEKPAEEKPAEEKPAEEKPAEEKPAEEKPAEEKPAEEKPAEEKPAEEKPAEEKPAEEKPAEEKTAEEKPAEEKPAEEKPAEEKPAEEKPAEEKPAE